MGIDTEKPSQQRDAVTSCSEAREDDQNRCAREHVSGQHRDGSGKL